MNLASQIHLQIDNPALSPNERAKLRCQIAKALEESGNYEGAREAMGELWYCIGERPIIENLDQETVAEVLLRVGVLTGWIGDVEQVKGAQEAAKDLLTRSATNFKTLKLTEKIAETHIELGLCYWREGRFEDARIVYKEALSHLTDTNKELRAITLLRSAAVETVSNQLHEALRIHMEAAPLFQDINNHALKGKFHNEFGMVLKYLGQAEYREDYIDRALIEYVAASYHFEEAGHARYQSCVENNLGFLLFSIGKFTEAHEHLDRAQALFTSLKDSCRLAGVDETRAKVFLAEGRTNDAEKLVRSAVQILERGGEQSLYAEALTTHGKALARLKRYQQAQLSLQHAIEVAHQAGDNQGAGQAALVMIEELGEHLNADDLSATYERAADLLEGSQHLEILGRLHACARKVLHLLVGHPVPVDWRGFSLKREVRRFERRFIERALQDAKGSVTRAARLLGFKHQTLIALMNSRHRNLLHIRKPVTRRRHSIFRSAVKPIPQEVEKAVRPVVILHVEDNKLAADAVRDALKAEGWNVEVCADGEDALRKLESNEHYDLLLFDDDLPGVKGIELVRHTRKLTHRRNAPIIMLSAVNRPREALKAGANLFLRKPDDISALPENVARLLADKSENH